MLRLGFILKKGFSSYCLEMYYVRIEFNLKIMIFYYVQEC